MASTYSSEADLNLDPMRLIELTEFPSAVGMKDQATVDNLSDDAQGLIDGALYGKYKVPFTAPIPVAVKYLHADLWRYLLFKRRDSLTIPERVVADFKQAMDDLKAFASEGGAVLPAPTAGAGTAPGTTYGSFSADIDDTNQASRIFGRYKDGLG